MAKSGLGESPTKESSSFLVLLRAPQYAGLPAPCASPFLQFPPHPLYLFPIAGEVCDPHWIELGDSGLQDAFMRLQRDSPFRSEEILPFPEAACAVPDNSLCSHSQACDSLSQYADPLLLSQEVFRSSYIPPSDLSLASQEALESLQRAFTAVQQDQLNSLFGSSFEDSRPAEASCSFRPSEVEDSRNLYRRFRPSEMSEDVSMSIVEEGQAHRLPVFTTAVRPNLPCVREERKGNGRIHCPFPKPCYVQAKVLAASVTPASFMTAVESTFSPYREAISTVVCKLVIFGRKAKGEYELQVALPLCGCYISPKVEFSQVQLASKDRYPRNISEMPAICSLLLAPKALKQLLSAEIAWVTCGFEHIVALTSSGDVLTWGYGASGVLGHGDTSTVLSPRLVGLSNIVCIESGAYHTAAIGQEGEVWTWGRGDMWQLGHHESEMSRDEMGYAVLRPKVVDYFRDKVGKGVACGEAHTLVLEASGQVYSFGWGAFGQLGRGPWDMHLPAAEQVGLIPCLARVSKVSCGLLFSTCLTDTGQVWTWGSGNSGQLGRGAVSTQSSTPQRVATLSANVIDVVCGESHVLAVGRMGEVYAWGSGIAGKLDGFQPGMEVVCYFPQRLDRLEAVWGLLSPEQTQQEFTSDLQAQLQQLQYRNRDSVYGAAASSLLLPVFPYSSTAGSGLFHCGSPSFGPRNPKTENPALPLKAPKAPSPRQGKVQTGNRSQKTESKGQVCMQSS